LLRFLDLASTHHQSVNRLIFWKHAEYADTEVTEELCDE
jgi:hypothetical protein